MREKRTKLTLENIEDIEIGTSSGETPGAAAAAGSRHASEDMSTKPNAKEPHEEPNAGGEEKQGIQRTVETNASSAYRILQWGDT